MYYPCHSTSGKGELNIFVQFLLSLLVQDKSQSHYRIQGFQIYQFVMNLRSLIGWTLGSMKGQIWSISKSLTSEVTPSGTQFFKRSYKISHNPGL